MERSIAFAREYIKFISVDIHQRQVKDAVSVEVSYGRWGGITLEIRKYLLAWRRQWRLECHVPIAEQRGDIHPHMRFVDGQNIFAGEDRQNQVQVAVAIEVTRNNRFSANWNGYRRQCFESAISVAQQHQD